MFASNDNMHYLSNPPVDGTPQQTNELMITMRNDCDEKHCCENDHTCTDYTSGQLTSTGVYGHGTFYFDLQLNKNVAEYEIAKTRFKSIKCHTSPDPEDFPRIMKATPTRGYCVNENADLSKYSSNRDLCDGVDRDICGQYTWEINVNTPIFFIRDPIFFPSFIHTQKRNPVTHLKDPDMFWDFISLRPETCHQVSFLFSDRGTPMGYRHMNGYGSHTFKLVNIDGEAVYCKFHFKCDQGIRCFYAEEADKMGAEDPDYAIRDLYNAIASGQPPSWTLYIQVVTFEEAENFKWNPFDLTKTWPQGEFPLIQVGKMILNENPKNYFAEVEQIAFSPSHMVPGVEPSPDKMLQGRLFSYPDTHRHRLGSNYMQIPINCPFQNKRKVTSYQRDGPQCVTDNNAGAPNYYPNSFNGPVDGLRAEASRERQTRASTFEVSSDVKRWNTADDARPYGQCEFRQLFSKKAIPK